MHSVLSVAGAVWASAKRMALTVALGAAFVAGAAANPAQASTIDIAFSDNAATSFTANPGDQFFASGLSGNVTLTSGVASLVSVLHLTEQLTCCWDDQLYATTVNHTLTLNGVGGDFSQLWQVMDFEDPTSSLGGAGPLVFNLPNGTVTVSMIGGEGFGHSTASLLYQDTAGVPEPATWALMIGGFGMAGAALRRRRSVLAA